MPTTPPSPALAAVERLRRLAPALAEGDDDARWLADALGRYLAAAAAGVDLDQALGLATPPGGAPWWRAAADAERDRLIRELAAETGGSVNARAGAVQARLKRYGSTAWVRDRVTKQPTAANRLLFEIFSHDATPPTGIRRLTDIISR